MFAELAPVWFKQHFIHSWLPFAAAADFFVYFWVNRLVNNTTGMMSLLFICIFVCIIFSLVNSRFGPCVNKR